MKHFPIRLLTILVTIVTAVLAFQARAAAPVPAAPGAPPAVVTKFFELFDRLRAAEAEKARGGHLPVSFRISDSEIDEYMRYSLQAQPRPGLDSVTVKIFSANYISTFMIVDFDAVERWHPGTIPAILRPVLSGKRSMWVDFRIQANDFKIGFTVEKAYYQNIGLPAFVVNKVIQIVAARQPEKYDTSQPMTIPFGLRKLWTSDHVMQGEN